MKKRLFALSITLAMLVSLAAPAMAVSVKEVDMPEYTSIDTYSEGLAAAIDENGGYCYLDTSGQQAITLRVEDMLSERISDPSDLYLSLHAFSDGMAVIGIGGIGELEGEYVVFAIYGYINKAGRVVVPGWYTEVKPFSEGFGAVQDADSGLWGYVNREGEEVIPCQYAAAESFSDGFAAVQDADSGLWGYVDQSGKEAIPCRYDNAFPFSDGLAAVTNAEGLAFIDSFGQVALPLKNTIASVQMFQDGFAAVSILAEDNDGRQQKRYGFIDTTGKLVVPTQYSEVSFFYLGLAAVQDAESGLWGYVDQNGKQAVPCRYASAGTFSEEGLAPVQDADSGLWGFVDRSGNEAIPCRYAQVSYFSQGLAVVQDADSMLCGYIDKDGKEVVPCRYVYAGVAADSCAVVAAGKVEGLNMLTDYSVLALSDGETPSPTAFTDVPEGSWCAEPVAWAVAEQVTSGTGVNTFSPNATCSSAQILTFLWRAKGMPVPEESQPSVPAGQYYSDAANWALENGVADTFEAELPCTRAMVAQFLWRLAGSPQVSAENPFADVAEDAPYVQAVLWAVEQGITSGTSATTFSPDSACTRGEIVTFLYRAYGA